MAKTSSDQLLLRKIRACTLCKKFLPFAPRPVLNFRADSKVVIIGQAPGTRVHATGIPWNDPSGERLRAWLGVTREQFYNPDIFAIVPMGFCYPGKGKTGDLPPRPECAATWIEPIFSELKQVELVVLIGQYAQKYFLRERMKKTLTETVAHWRDYYPQYVVLPHPSPRNNIWLKKNPWFEREELPALRKCVKKYLV